MLQSRKAYQKKNFNVIAITVAAGALAADNSFAVYLALMHANECA